MRRLALGLLAFLLPLLVVPRLVCGWRAGDWYDGDLETRDAFAQGLIQALEDNPELLFYRTGSTRFDGQSAVATYQMTLLALGQIALEHPEKRASYLPAMRLAAERLADPRTLTYAAERYGQHGAVAMDAGEGHAYLGYINLGLSMLRLLEPDTPIAAVNDRITAALAARVGASKTGLIETYPGESWPPDVAAVVGSIGLHATATGTDRSALLQAWEARFTACALHPSGYLVQRVETTSCEPADAPRGSGTAVSAYFLSFSNPELSRRLAAALATTGRRSLLGFGALREYAPGFVGRGDLNAGPIVAGVSVGATGFGLGAARAAGDRALFVELYRTAHLFGAPFPTEHGERFAVGGALGNALLLAMLTARPP